MISSGTKMTETTRIRIRILRTSSFYLELVEFTVTEFTKGSYNTRHFEFTVTLEFTKGSYNTRHFEFTVTLEFTKGSYNTRHFEFTVTLEFTKGSYNTRHFEFTVTLEFTKGSYNTRHLYFLETSNYRILKKKKFTVTIPLIYSDNVFSSNMIYEVYAVPFDEPVDLPNLARLSRSVRPEQDIFDIRVRRRSLFNFSGRSILSVSVEDLAKDGFYLEEDHIRCAYCNSVYPYRCTNPNVRDVHRRLNPNCCIVEGLLDGRAHSNHPRSLEQCQAGCIPRRRNVARHCIDSFFRATRGSTSLTLVRGETSRLSAFKGVQFQFEVTRVGSAKVELRITGHDLDAYVFLPYVECQEINFIGITFHFLMYFNENNLMVIDICIIL